jgi:hypothetical protein
MKNEERRLSDLPGPETDQVRDALLGKDLEIDVDTAESILQSYGISSDTLVDELKALMQERIRTNTREGTKTEETENLHHFVRDITNYKRARAPDSVKPDSWIKSIIDNTTAGLFPNHTTAQAYRGRKDGSLSDQDQNLIDEIEAELNGEE